MSLVLRAQVAAAAHDIVPSWPLDSFIAVNPLAGAESQPFGSVGGDTALTRPTARYVADLHRGRIPVETLERALISRVPVFAQTVCVGGREVQAATIAALDMIEHPDDSSRHHPDVELALDRYLSTWIAAYLNPDPLWAMPHRDEGFYGAWRRLAVVDPTLPRWVRLRVAGAPDAPDAALAKAVSATPTSEVTPMLREQLAPLPGWVAHIKWRAEKVGDIDLTNYLAARLTLAAAYGSRTAPPSVPPTAHVDTTWQRAVRIADTLTEHCAEPHDIAAVARVLGEHPAGDHALTWQTAYEDTYRTELLRMLRSSPQSIERPEVQVVLCIDPRSEGLRRHLERYRGVETLGFAGFFGVPIRFSRYAAQGGINALPALLTPRHRVTEHPLDAQAAAKTVASSRVRAALAHALHAADSATISPFAFAETTGWLAGAFSALSTFAPSVHARLQRALVPHPDTPTRLTIEETFTLEERVNMASTGLRMMGMTRLAPLVLITGHGSHSTNNLYQSALDCGACGGNPGGANARAAAALFNDPDVRAVLGTRGLVIPDDTVFVAAQHDTVRDTVTVLDPHTIPESHRKRMHEFDELHKEAGTRLVAERAHDLPGATSRRTVTGMRRRADDWAEVYPELGLAGNAAMIIGPRELTCGVDLARRVFLHSYRAEHDPDGSALETIMTAPLIVAQWINHQYYFSTLNPRTLGAGTKTIHNAIGTLGVLAGHGGDLRRGLPWQSVGVGERLLHEPMRLSVIIEAPLDRIGRIISGNQVLRNLLDNEWISLTARDDIHHSWHRYTRYGWAPTTTETMAQKKETHA